jgi:hypothetical protein
VSSPLEGRPLSGVSGTARRRASPMELRALAGDIPSRIGTAAGAESCSDAVDEGE